MKYEDVGRAACRFMIVPIAQHLFMIETSTWK
ncbi:hypothetical protein COLO4_05011 [Corchorus olitorius]|uniref:Uncharacterized protein n=1 Tax=Corchorus olitorius TaxID=93759 RepID=A0A1R3KS43_9ROSI|nr:hypothetical protein COLO4_05011 [Corchorus olitorius]